MTSKCGKSEKVANEPLHECVTDVDRVVRCFVLVQDKAIAEEQVKLVKRQQERIQKLKKVNCRK